MVISLASASPRRGSGATKATNANKRTAPLRPAAKAEDASEVATRVENDARRSVTFSESSTGIAVPRNALESAPDAPRCFQRWSRRAPQRRLSGHCLSGRQVGSDPDDIELLTAVSKHHSSRDGTGGDHDGCFAARSDDHRQLADRDDMPWYLAARLLREPASGERNRNAFATSSPAWPHLG